MAGTTFDPDLTFDANLEALLADLDHRNPKLTVILREHLHLLRLEGDDAARRQHRDTFNSLVKASLDASAAAESQ